MRKRRTRQHVIEDLSYNYVEKQVLLAFGVFNRAHSRDYGYDGTIITFDKNGEVETGYISVQVKAKETLKYSNKNKGFELTLEKRDLELWLFESFPVIIVLYDSQHDLGYFLDLKSYFKENRIILKNIHKTKNVFIPKKNNLTFESIEILRTQKNELNENFKNI